MDLRQGFTIERPAVTVPWSITESELEKLVREPELRRVTTRYYTLPVTVLGGLQCMLGFHFRDLRARLTEFEFFRASAMDQHTSFDEFQRHFEQEFGPPSHTSPGDRGVPFHQWQLPGAFIVHYLFDRFGPEEHMRIQRAT